MSNIDDAIKNGRGLFGGDRDADRRDDDFEIEIHLDKPISIPIDRPGSAFDRETVRYVGGINTAPSAFSRQTLFNVTTENPDDAQEERKTLKEPYGTHSDR